MGMAQNQYPTRLISATLRPRAVGEGVGTEGRRSATGKESTMMELNVVRGSWPIPAVRMPVRILGAVGKRVEGCHMLSSGM